MSHAVITVLDGMGRRIDLATADSAGVFSLAGHYSDSIRVRVERLGYAFTESVPLTLGTSDTLRLEVHLRPQPLTIDALTAHATPVRWDANLRGFARRMQNGFGRYLGPADLADGRVSTAMDVLGRIGGASLLFDNAGRWVYARSPGGYCTPRIFVDGALIRELVQGTNAFGMSYGTPMVPVDNHVRAAEIRGVEYYRIPRQAPPQYQAIMGADPRTKLGTGGGECPVVLIWTDWGFGWGRR